MQKEVFVLKGTHSESNKEFKVRMFELMDQVLNECDPKALKICITVNRPPLISVIPFRKQKTAAISIIPLSNMHRQLMEKSLGYQGGYLVEECLPAAYEKDWTDKTVTPGVCLLTLFHRKPSIDPKTFLDRWFNGHTPLSLRLHPLWHYNRNEVKQKLSDQSEDYDGIVEEHFRKKEELLNPLIFFGPPFKALYHMYLVLKDTRGFIDMKRIETYLTQEYHWKTNHEL